MFYKSFKDKKSILHNDIKAVVEDISKGDHTEESLRLAIETICEVAYREGYIDGFMSILND